MVCCEVRMWVLGCGSDIYLPSVWQTLFANFPGKCKMLATLKHWLGGREGGYNTITHMWFKKCYIFILAC